MFFLAHYVSYGAPREHTTQPTKNLKLKSCAERY